jgi:hypothetical protein
VKGRVAADGTEAWNLRLVGHHMLGGHGDTMHVNVSGGFAYVGHMGDDRVGTSVVDVSDPSSPRLVTQLTTPPGTHSHKVQIVDNLLLVNYERNPGENPTEWTGGLAVFDISEPARPALLSLLRMPGKGVHRMTFWQQPYAVMSGSDDGFTDQFFVVVDLTDPTAPVEVGRWWLPGMNAGAGEPPSWPDGRVYKHHHSIVRGNRAYGGWWDAGLVILDVTDVGRPELVSRLDFGADSGATHTALPLPGRDVLVVTDECVHAGPRASVPDKHIRLVDITDDTAPKVVGRFPTPEGDYRDRPGRSGPHNLHEMRPGSFTSSRTVHATYFNAGLRVFDVTDPAAPAEIAVFVPPPAPGCPSLQFNDLTVAEDGLIYVTDRAGGGLYIVAPEIEFP